MGEETVSMRERIAAIRTMSVASCIFQERVKQDTKWGEQNHQDTEWASILMEEVGEAAECVNKSCIGPIEDEEEAAEYRGLLEIELIQVAAVAIAWLECIRRQDQGEQGKRGRRPRWGRKS